MAEGSAQALVGLGYICFYDSGICAGVVHLVELGVDRPGSFKFLVRLESNPLPSDR